MSKKNINQDSTSKTYHSSSKNELDEMNDLMSKIQKAKPYSKNHFLFQNILYILFIFFFGIFAIIMSGVFWGDLFELLLLSNLSGFGFWEIFDPMFEFLILATLLSVFIYLIYRRTDWPFVQNKKWFIIILVSFVMVGGLFYVNIFGFESISQVRDSSQQIIPLRQQRRDNIGNRLIQEGVYIGFYVEYNPSKEILTIQTKEGIFDFSIDRKMAAKLKEIDLKKPILVKTNNKNNSKNSDDLKPDFQEKNNLPKVQDIKPAPKIKPTNRDLKN